MSLEEALNRNSDLLAQNNEIMSKLLGAAGTINVPNASGESGEGEKGDKPKGRGAVKDKDGDKSAGAGFEISFDDLKIKLLDWLAEFAKESDKKNPSGTHPEVTARKAALKANYEKLKVENLAGLKDDAKKLTALNKWFETKAKVEDPVGAGVGRLAADPSSDAEDESGDDEL